MEQAFKGQLVSSGAGITPLTFPASGSHLDGTQLHRKCSLYSQPIVHSHC